MSKKKYNFKLLRPAINSRALTLFFEKLDIFLKFVYLRKVFSLFMITFKVLQLLIFVNFDQIE